MKWISGLTGNYLLLGKVIALLAALSIAVYAWYQFTGHYIDIGKEEIQSKWDAQKAIDADAIEKRKHDNFEKESKAKKDINDIEYNYQNEINKIRNKYDAVKKDNVLANSSVDAWRDRLQIELSKGDGLSNIPIATEIITSNGKDDYTASLRAACEITTVEYNALHDAWDKACVIYKCE